MRNSDKNKNGKTKGGYIAVFSMCVFLCFCEVKCKMFTFWKFEDTYSNVVRLLHVQCYMYTLDSRSVFCFAGFNKNGDTDFAISKDAVVYNNAKEGIKPQVT